MKICLGSDTHNQLLKIKWPSADLLLHAGDFTMRGDLSEVAQFNYDCGMIKRKFKHGIIGTCGNHDFLFEKSPNLARTLTTNFKYLENESVVVNGFKIYASPATPFFFDWAFNFERGEDIKQQWDLIPDDTDVLITHGPPYGILDTIPNGDKVGCEDLLDAVVRVKPRLHVFGHIHHSYGMDEHVWNDGSKTIFVNAAICTERYKPTNEPIVVEL